MKKSKLLVFCFLILILASAKSYSQNCTIDVITEVVNTASGQANGAVSFKMKNQSALMDHFIIFDLTAARNGVTDKIKLSSNSLESLAAGKYEFLIVDKKKEKCAKEILVEIKEQ